MIRLVKIFGASKRQGMMGPRYGRQQVGSTVDLPDRPGQSRIAAANGRMNSLTMRAATVEIVGTGFFFVFNCGEVNDVSFLACFVLGLLVDSLSTSTNSGMRTKGELHFRAQVLPESFAELCDWLRAAN